MPFQLSPGVNVTEIDLTTVVPAVASSDGAIAGIFNWGPVGERMLIDSESKLVNVYGKPNNNNAETWFTAANFLSYGNRLFVNRAANTTSLQNRAVPALNAFGNTAKVWTNYNIVGNTSQTNSTPNVFLLSAAADKFVVGDQVYFETNGVDNSITGVKNETFYYVSFTNTSAFAISATYNGTNVDISTSNTSSPGPEYTISKASVNHVVKNSIDFNNDHVDPETGLVTGFDEDLLYIAKYPGLAGNSIRVGVCDSVDAFSSQLYSDSGVDGANFIYDDLPTKVEASFGIDIGQNSADVTFAQYDDGTALMANAYAYEWTGKLAIGDTIIVGNTSIGIQYAKITSFANTANLNQTSTLASEVITADGGGAYVTVNFENPYRLSSSFTSDMMNNPTVTRQWEFHNLVDGVPGTSDYVSQFGNNAAVDEIHVVVVDQLGKFTGVPGNVLEVYKGLSRASDAKTNEGAGNFYKTVINQSSQYIWVATDRVGSESATAMDIQSSTNSSALDIQFSLGIDGYTESTTSLATIARGYDLFGSSEDIDISLILQGKPIAGSATDSQTGLNVNKFQLANYLIDNIVENRKDCVAFITPDDGVVTGNRNNEATAIVAWRNAVHDSSYAVLDSGYKYQYDRYNDVYRYVPSNGDVAGLCARTDSNRDPWWSPAGFNRGQIKNLVKLRFNPRKADRDVLYKNGVNPLTTFPGQGTVLYGDKTLQSKPSAFDRINVRRLFIVLEKAISTAAKFTLFEFNDEFTRAQFKNLVTPYLRDVQGRRGITDFLVVCDATNNTGERVDRNEFWGDIYIKPARSINFIQLNFVAVRTGVQFSEIVGKF